MSVNKYMDDVIRITGDFNLTNIDWNLSTITSKAGICNMLIDEFSIRSFSQLVTTPTHGQNILDLSVTNRPTGMYSG